MQVIQGRGVSGGTVLGPVFFFEHEKRTIDRRPSSDPDAEWARFQEAGRAVAEAYGRLASEVTEELGQDAGLLFRSHQMIALDSEFEKSVRAAVYGKRQRAEAAVEDAARLYAAVLQKTEDPYFRERTQDLYDVAERILRKLVGEQPRTADLPFPAILAADSILPGELVRLERTRLLGLLLKEGSPTSHVAVLARIMGIPAVIAPESVPRIPAEGETVLLDGNRGFIVLNPDEETRQKEVLRRSEEIEREAALRRRFSENGSGLRVPGIRVECNISSLQDLPAVLRSGADGIGLFRSEFLYLDREDFPDEETQLSVYRALIEGMEGKPVTIRTLDPSPDKFAPYFDPELRDTDDVSRGIRYSLEHPEVFRTQLRALHRAAAEGNLRILLPMVTEAAEVSAARAMSEQVLRELKEEGIPSAGAEIGVMIETPAAALDAEEIAKEADFFSCGTNDLTRFTLAKSGEDAVRDPEDAGLHPAVRALLQAAASAAHRAGIPFGVCGESASDPGLAGFFLESGVDELSVSPGAVLTVREALRSAFDARENETGDLK